MPSPEFPTPPRLPDFMSPFDSDHPVPNHQEQMEAAALLRSVLEGKILELQHGLQPASENDGIYSGLALESYDVQGKPVDISIEITDTQLNPDLPDYIILLCDGPRYGNGSTLYRHDYSVHSIRSGEGVSRRDLKPVNLPVPSDSSERLDTIDPEVLRKRILEVIESMDVEEDFEKNMGLNDQPIGVNEAQVIAMILARAKLKVDPPE